MRITRVLAVFAAVAAVVVPVALGFGFDDSVNPPGGIVGTPYSFKFVARGGCPPYSFSLKTGALPPGLSLDSGGTISGTPTTAGNFSFWVELHDSAVTCPPNGSVPSQRPFSIAIDPKLTVTTPSPLPRGTVGTAYSLKLTSAGGGSNLTWSMYSGTLPAGLSLSADGTISGTPTADTNAPVVFTVKVSDGSRADTKSLALDVVAALTTAAPPPQPAEVGHPLKPMKITATGGRAPYAWTLAGQPPQWLTFDPDVGIGGTPEAAGAFTFQVVVKDAYGTEATQNVILVVRNQVAVRTSKLPTTKVGRKYRWLLRASAGVSPFTWKVTSGKFPVGIRLNRRTGLLSGKPRQAGTFRLTFQVRDSLGVTSDARLQLKVLPLKKHKTKKK